MSELEQDPGSPETVEKSTDWTQALTETLKAASEPDPSTETPAAEPKPDPSDVAKGAEAKVGESPKVDALQPLEKWPDEVKTLFSSLDAKAQQFLLDRERDVESHLTKRSQELSESQKRYARLDDVLKPYDEVAKRQGVDLTPHVAQALQHYMAYQRDPASTLKQLIQASQLSQEQLFGQEEADPTIRALRTDLAQTRNEVAQLKQGQSQVSESQLAQQIQAFKDAKDEKGEMQNPHFERVRHLMAPLVAEGKSMQDAYNEVVWAVPEHREAVAKAERAKAEKEAKAEAERQRVTKVKNAKRAETLPASDSDRGTAQKKMKNWEDALRETLSRSH